MNERPSESANSWLNINISVWLCGNDDDDDDIDDDGYDNNDDNNDYDDYDGSHDNYDDGYDDYDGDDGDGAYYRNVCLLFLLHKIQLSL